MSEIANRIKKPLAVTTAALAGLAMNGCGGGDKSLDFKVLCKDNSQLRVIGTKQPGYLDDSSITIACEDAQEKRQAPRSIQLSSLAGGSAVSANFALHIRVDQEGDAGFSADTTASFDVAPENTQFSVIHLQNVDKIEEVKVSAISADK